MEHYIDSVIVNHGPISIEGIIRKLGMGFVTCAACGPYAWDTVEKQLTTDPGKYIEDDTGRWSLNTSPTPGKLTTEERE